jgi:cyclopropane fatty-acyl-phospholipid synthase-like methyltransferase
MDNTNAQVWEKIFSSQAWGQYPESTIVRFLARNFANHPNRKEVKILELGAGPGVNLWLLTREGYSAFAIEFSPTAAEKAKQRLIKEGTQELLCEIKVGDYFEKLDEFKNDYFDAIIDYESLYCNPFARTQEIVKKAVAKLKKNGKFFSVTFSERTWGFEGTQVDYHAVVATEGPLANKGFSRFSTKEDVTSLFNNNELEITNLELIERHLGNERTVSEWVVEAIKK